MPTNLHVWGKAEKSKRYLACVTGFLAIFLPLIPLGECCFAEKAKETSPTSENLPEMVRQIDRLVAEGRLTDAIPVCTKILSLDLRTDVKVTVLKKRANLYAHLEQ